MYSFYTFVIVAIVTLKRITQLVRLGYQEYQNQYKMSLDLPGFESLVPRNWVRPRKMLRAITHTFSDYDLKKLKLILVLGTGNSNSIFLTYKYR